MTDCEKCGKTHNYYGPHSERTKFIKIELRDERTHGSIGVLHYCPDCAPFGNTKIPGKLGL